MATSVVVGGGGNIFSRLGVCMVCVCMYMWMGECIYYVCSGRCVSVCVCVCLCVCSRKCVCMCER